MISAVTQRRVASSRGRSTCRRSDGSPAFLMYPITTLRLEIILYVMAVIGVGDR